MTVICAGSDMAHRLAVAVGGAVRFAATIGRALELVRTLGARVLLLDVRAGGNQARAVEAVPAVLAQDSRVFVIMISPRPPSAAEVAEADALGAYNVVDFKAAGFAAHLRYVIEVAVLMQPLQPVLLPRLSSPSTARTATTPRAPAPSSPARRDRTASTVPPSPRPARTATAPRPSPRSGRRGSTDGDR